MSNPFWWLVFFVFVMPFAYQIIEAAR